MNTLFLQSYLQNIHSIEQSWKFYVKFLEWYKEISQTKYLPLIQTKDNYLKFLAEFKRQQINISTLFHSHQVLEKLS